MSEIDFRHLAASIDTDIDLLHGLISILQGCQQLIECPSLGLGSAARLPLLIQLIYRPLLGLGRLSDVSDKTPVGPVDTILLNRGLGAVYLTGCPVYDVPGRGHRELNHLHTCVSSSR